MTKPVKPATPAPALSLELHVVQSYPVNRMNRGQDNAPKSIVFGGTRRARVSSQAQKYAERHSDAVALPEGGAAWRTKTPHTLIEAAIPDEYREALAIDGAQAVIRTAMTTLYGAYDEKGKLKSQALIAQDEVERLAALLAPQLERLASTPADDRTDAVKVVMTEFSPGTANANVALYGRFVAETDGWDVEAAVSVSHAISTHRVENEVDFFGAVDDVSGQVSHIGEVDITAPTMYRVATLDLRQLQRNLPSVEMAALARAWAMRTLTSVPGGARHGAFASTLPEYVLIIARRGGHPVNLAGAFETPVRRTEHGSVAVNSVAALEDHFGRLAGLYGPFGQVYAASVSTLTLAGDVTRAQSLDRALQDALSALGL